MKLLLVLAVIVGKLLVLIYYKYRAIFNVSFGTRFFDIVNCLREKVRVRKWW